MNPLKPEVQVVLLAIGLSAGLAVAGDVAPVTNQPPAVTATYQPDPKMAPLPMARRLESPAPVWPIALSRQGTQVAGLTRDGRIVLWDFAAGKPTGTIAGVPTNINWLAFSADGRQLVGLPFGQLPPEGKTNPPPVQVSVWDVKTQAKTASIDTQLTSISRTLIAPRGPWLLVWERLRRKGPPSPDPKLRILDVAQGTVAASLNGGQPFGFSPDGTRLLFNDGGGCVWRLPMGGPVARGFFKGMIHPDVAVFLPDSVHVIVGGPHHDLRLMVADTGALVRSYQDAFAPKGGENTPTMLSPEGKHLLVDTAGVKDRGVRVVEVATGAVKSHLIGVHRGAEWVGADTIQIHERSGQGTFLLHVFTGKVLGRLTAGWALASPDGKSLLTPVGAKEGEYGIGIWDVPVVPLTP